MKHHHKEFWGAVKAILVVVALWMMHGPATTQPISGFKATQSASGPVIEFTDGDFILTPGLQSPTSGWVHAPLPQIYRMHETRWRTGDFHNLVGRFRFDRARMSPGPMALYTVSTRNQFIILVNGAEVFRNFARVTDQKMAWYRPFYIPIPAATLRSGQNEIVIRTVSQESVGIGRVLIGPSAAVQDYYQTQFFWRITAVAATSLAMLMLGGLAFLLWLGRRQEVELLFLTLATTLWFLRNYQYFGETIPFDMATFNALTVYATYFTCVATFAFYVCFLKTPRRGLMIVSLFALGVLISLVHGVFSLSNTILYLATIFVAFSMGILGLLDLRHTCTIEHIILVAVMLLIPLLGVYDFMLASREAGWNGNDFYLAVFNGFFYCLAFLISFGKRALDAFTALGDANATLVQRIAETRAELALSEAARQKLVVGSAIATERERLMQEMHDGIGSNLITALAVARQQKQPASTIKTLSRALGDLKITVDSLEPIEGDLVALIGNLRHRMAGDLRDAGITCKWEATPCGPLPWLDATNALHVLRIIQEAIGNVLTHAGASELRIGCREAERGGVPGIAAYVADNGCGFAGDHIDTPGKGLANIHARASSFHGALECSSAVGSGTIITLWLPYARIMPRSAPTGHQNQAEQG